MRQRLLNARHRKFAHEYVRNGFNGVQAAFVAGYTLNYFAAGVTAHRLLKNVKVMSEIEQHVKKSKLSADNVIERLSDIAQTPTKIDGNHVLKSLELLGKAHKLWDNQSQPEQSTTINFQVSLESAKLTFKTTLISRGIPEIEAETRAEQFYQKYLNPIDSSSNSSSDLQSDDSTT